MLRNITYIFNKDYIPHMGLLGFLFKKNKKKEGEKEAERSELKKAFVKGYAVEDSGRKAVLLENMLSEEPKLYSPAVEHPLLTIQDRISKLEDIYRSLNDLLVVIDGKVATKQDIESIKALVHDDLQKGDLMLMGIGQLGERLDSLRKVRNELTRQVDETTRQLTRKAETLEKIDGEIELLECDQKIIAALEGEDKSTIELAKDLSLTRQYIWGRLKELQALGYVNPIKRGRKTKYHLEKKT